MGVLASTTCVDKQSGCGLVGPGSLPAGLIISLLVLMLSSNSTPLAPCRTT